MAGNLSVNDVVYIYSRLEPLAKDMQKTRSAFIMARDTFLDTLAAAHMPVAAPAQQLTPQQEERKRFYAAVTAARREWEGFGQSRMTDFGGATLAPTDDRIIRMVN